MHEVHTLSRFGVLPTSARTVWMLGFQRRRVRRCECEMLLPKPGPLPQTSQVAATGDTPKTHRTHTGDARGRSGNRHRVSETPAPEPIAVPPPCPARLPAT